MMKTMMMMTNSMMMVYFDVYFPKCDLKYLTIALGLVVVLVPVLPLVMALQASLVELGVTLVIVPLLVYYVHMDKLVEHVVVVASVLVVGFALYSYLLHGHVLSDLAYVFLNHATHYRGTHVFRVAVVTSVDFANFVLPCV